MFKYLVAVAMALMLAACGGKAGSSDALAGTYGVSKDGSVQPFLKIEKAGDQYVAYEHANDGSWKPLKQQISPFTSADLSKLTGRTEASDVTGVRGNSFAFFKVPVGWSEHSFTSQTGYVVFAGLKLYDLQRM